jgi:hypothetical protein
MWSQEFHVEKQPLKVITNNGEIFLDINIHGELICRIWQIVFEQLQST